MEYLVEIKTICDSLIAVDSPDTDREQVQHILCTLGLEYNIFCAALQVLSTLPTFYELKAKLLKYETQNIDVISDTIHGSCCPIFQHPSWNIKRDMHPILLWCVWVRNILSDLMVFEIYTKLFNRYSPPPSF